MPSFPEPIRQHLLVAQQACVQLAGIARQAGYEHQFTLDGRFVGDVGELIAARFFDISLHPRQRCRHDGECLIAGRARGVQVKCRRKSTVLDISWQPELLLVLEIDEAWHTWDTVYNGPGDFLSADGGYATDDNGALLLCGTKHARRIYLDQLRILNKALSPTAPRVPGRTSPSSAH